MGYIKIFKRVRRIKGKRKYIIQGKFIFDEDFIKLDYSKGFIWNYDGVPQCNIRGDKE